MEGKGQVTRSMLAVQSRELGNCFDWDELNNKRVIYLDSREDGSPFAESIRGTANLSEG